MPLATMTSKGQVTVPKEVRERLGLRAGVRVEFRIEEDGTAKMVPASRKVAQLVGALSGHAKKRPVSVQAMDASVKKAFREGSL